MPQPPLPLREKGDGARRVLALAAALVMSCATAASSSSPLEAGFRGVWMGTATLALTGKDPIPYSVSLTVTTSGNVATLHNACPGIVNHDSLRQQTLRLPTEGARPVPSLDATGSGASAAWSGTLDCPQVSVSGCAELASTYTNATLTLTGDNQLTVVITGRATGCGVSYPLLITFVGAT